MGRRAKFTAVQAEAAFKRVRAKVGHVPSAREYAAHLGVSVATAWLMMIRLNLRKPCKHCRGTGWERSQAEKRPISKKLPSNSTLQSAPTAGEV